MIDTKPIIKELEQVSAHSRTSTIFDAWLELVDATLRMLPVHARCVAETGEMAEDDAEAKETWARLKAAGYDSADFEHFKRAFHLLLAATQEPDGTPIWCDPLGVIYMEWASANLRNAQFFTPWEICKVMAMMTMGDVESMLREKIVEAVGADTLEMAGLNPELPHTLRHIAENLLPYRIAAYETITVTDCCCGSGTMLLAAASVCPLWAVRMGLVQFSGQDIDHTCCLMARSNLRLFGLNGYGLQLRAAGLGIAIRQAAMEETTPADIEIGTQTELFGNVVKRPKPTHFDRILSNPPFGRVKKAAR